MGNETFTQRKGVTYYLGLIVEALNAIAIGRFVQADWTEADSEAPSYIKNKPTIPVAPGVFTTEDLTALTAEQLDAMSPGDVVINLSDGGDSAYHVNFKSTGALSLTYADSGKVETVKYIYDHDAWSYDETVTTTIGS